MLDSDYSVENYVEDLRAIAAAESDPVKFAEVFQKQPECDRDGIATTGLLVRHLVLPGQLDNSRRCLRFLAELSPDIHLSIMSQYAPRHNARDHSGIDQALASTEYEEITRYALDLGLENPFIQELGSESNYLPDFDRDRPFEFDRPRPFEFPPGSEVKVKSTLG